MTHIKVKNDWYNLWKFLQSI